MTIVYKEWQLTRVVLWWGDRILRRPFKAERMDELIPAGEFHWASQLDEIISLLWKVLSSHNRLTATP